MRSMRLRQAGFSLIEALTALLVVAFGMLAIAGFQVSLSASSDIAKQRSEAVRLAQLKIEELRAYQQVGSHTGTPHIFNYTDDLVDGLDTVGPSTATPTIVYPTNTLYTREWFVTGAGTDLQKSVRVRVRWNDRNGTEQRVDLQTVIARADPISIGTLAVGPGGSKTRSPKDRNVDIPYPAVSLAGGKSGFQPGSDTSPNPNPFFIFDDATGDVLGSCSTPLPPGAAVTWGGNCTEGKALLLSGYVRFVYGGWNANQVDDKFGNPNELTKRLSADVVFIDPTTTATAQCYTQRQKTIQRTGTLGDITNPKNLVFIAGASRVNGVVTVTTTAAHGFTTQDYININSATHFSFTGVFRVTQVPSATTFQYAQVANDESFTGGTPLSTASITQQVTIPEEAPIPTNYSSSQIVSRAVAYTCIVSPVDHDSNANTPRRWSGQFVITPQPTPGDSVNWTLGTSSQANDNQWKLCRYTGNYVTSNGLTNSEHPLYYRGVTGALDNQNYVAIQSNQNCPTDGLPSFTGNPRDYVNSNTTLHQTAVAGALPRGGLRSGTNPGGASNNGGFAAEENSDLSVELPMM